MKTVILMRHAKSSWKNEDLEDFDRPLNKRGKKDAPAMGELLQKKDQLPDLILSSSAKRARQTAKAVMKESGFSGEVEHIDSLYLAEPHAYIDALRKIPEGINRVMVIGHNPGLEGLLQQLSGRVESLPTSGVAFIDLPIQTWKELDHEVDGTLIDLWRPDRSKKGKNKK